MKRGGADAELRKDFKWWQREAIYEVYLRSFQDTGGNGTGDLAGVIRRLDYLKWLGIGAIWLTPFYPSPMDDFGYDVADYTDVDPRFGDLDTFDRLLREAHARGMRVIVDFVPNHTSDQHPWFLASRSSRQSEKRDWYIWADPEPEGGPPNNWLSEFTGSAWEYDVGTEQYYLHTFLPQQPDLNWRNPDVRRAMFDNMRFWLKRGVDGFRVDVMWYMLKDDKLRPNPPNPDFDPEKDSPYDRLLPVWSSNRPEVHDVVAEMRAVVDEFDDRLLIGEIYLPIDELVTYYGEQLSGAHLPFNFQLMFTPWEVDEVRSLVDRYQASLPEGAWPNWVLGNHDQTRLATRFGREKARAAALLLLTLRGTPTIYYGEEIGMENGVIAEGQAVDPRELRCPGRGLGRDPERTPMQWTAEPGAGFTTSHPWLPINDNKQECNVERQRGDPQSLLSLYRELLVLRTREQALAVGGYFPVVTENDVMAFTRSSEQGDDFLVAVNFDAGEELVELEDRRGEIIISTIDVKTQRPFSGVQKLRAWEGVLVRLERHTPA